MAETPQVKGYQFDSFILDLELRTLFVANRAIKLNAKAFDILRFLIERNGSVVEKDQLLERVWPNRIVEEGNLSVHIFSLRKILKAADPSSNYIETVPGSGYRFVARVTEMIPPRLPAEISNATPSVGATSEIIDLAVLPFHHPPNAEDSEYLADGFTESLINSLSRLPTLRVLSPSTIFRYRGLTRQAPQIGQALGVSAVVVGEIDRNDDQLVVNVELIKVDDGSSWWKHQYIGPAFKIFEIQQTITLALTEQLRLRLSSVEKQSLNRQTTRDVEAYRHFLKGQYWLARRSCSNLEKAATCFRQAVAQDPNYALAYANLADTLMAISGLGCAPCSSTILPAQRAIEQALAIDPSLAATHSTRGFFKIIYRIDWTSAEADLLHAIALDPTGVRAYNRYAMFLKNCGRFAECRDVIQRAFEVDPLSFVLYGLLGDSYFLTREYDRAVELAHEVLALEPHHLDMAYLLAKSLCELGRFDESLGILEPIYQIYQHPEIATQIAIVFARSGKVDRARHVLGEMLERREGQYIEAWDFALIYASLGELDLALAALERALEEQNRGVFMLRWDPRFDGLRSDPRFAQIIGQIGYLN